MANNFNAGFPAYGTAASQAANRAFTKEWQKKTEEETSKAAKKYTAASETTSANTSTTKAATYEKGTTAANVESYDKTGRSTSFSKTNASEGNTQTTVTEAPTGQVSGFARAGAVLNSNDYGKVVGEPKLSDEGAKYYNELKKKFKGLDFILVGRDSVQTAKQQQNSYANGNRLVVLIDEDKIEQMAKDPKFRNYYEGIIKQAQAGQFAQAQAQAQVAPKTGSSDKKGPNVLDNGAKGFLAASAKANKEFAKKTAKMREKKKADKKLQAKKEEKRAKEEKRKERLEEGREEKRAERSEERRVYHSAEMRYSHEELAKRPENLGKQQFEEIKPEDKPEGKFVDFKA